ncbi:MAG: hypothetical protein WBD27_07080 [Pyrinomonadaceae bacterium]
MPSSVAAAAWPVGSAGAIVVPGGNMPPGIGLTPVTAGAGAAGLDGVPGLPNADPASPTPAPINAPQGPPTEAPVAAPFTIPGAARCPNEPSAFRKSSVALGGISEIEVFTICSRSSAGIPVRSGRKRLLKPSGLSGNNCDTIFILFLTPETVWRSDAELDEKCGYQPPENTRPQPRKRFRFFQKLMFKRAG